MTVVENELSVEQQVNRLVADEIRSWMARRRLHQAWLADVLGLSQAAISKKLRGDAPFSVTQLLQLAGALDLSLSELMGQSLVNEKVPVRKADEDHEKLPQLDSNQQPFD